MHAFLGCVPAIAFFGVCAYNRLFWGVPAIVDILLYKAIFQIRKPGITTAIHQASDRLATGRRFHGKVTTASKK